MAVLDDLGWLVDTTDATLTLGTNLFLGRMPDAPDTCVCLFEYSGMAPLTTLGGDQLPYVEMPRIQAMTRHTSYASGRSLAVSVWQTLEGIVNETVNGNLYQRVSALQSVFPLERDSHDRIIFVQNFQVVKAV